jgi:hypothetical protein
MSRSFSDSAMSGSVPAHSAAASRMYSACTASSSGVDSISNSVDFLSRLLRNTSRLPNCAIVFRPTRSLNFWIWSVSSLRLAMTPPSRTL